MKRLVGLLWTGTLLLAPTAMAEERLPVNVNGKPLVSYQAAPMSKPKSGPKFKGSNFIHPLKTPSGFVVTDNQPSDHPHHFGLWWPWKYIESDGVKVLCWELQKGDGIIETRECTPIDNGFRSKSVYIARKAPGGPRTLLHETTTVIASAVVDKPARGYFLDLEIKNRTAGDKPVTVTAYRYSGFSLRGTSEWKKHNSTILTSEGKTRDEANFTRGRWVRVQGETGNGKRAGVILMSRPDNHAHPEKLRTWDKQHGGSAFINFNTVMDEPWVFQPGKDYTRNYRLFVYDGEVSATQAEALWREYVKPPPAQSQKIAAFALSPEWEAQLRGRAPVQAPATPKEKRKVLVFSLTTGFKHWCIPHTEAMVKALGEKTGAFTAVGSTDIEVFRSERLKQYDAVVLNNVCPDRKHRDVFMDVLVNKVDKYGAKYRDLPLAEREALARELFDNLVAYVAEGGGLIGLHGAIANFSYSDEFSDVIGGSFHYHPKQQDVVLNAVSPEHPLTKPFGGKPFIHRDEPYLFNRAYTKMNFHPLLEMDTTKLAPDKRSKDVQSIPRYVSWIKRHGEGRVFYCSPSHNAQSFERPELLAYILGGIQYALGDLSCPDAPVGEAVQ